MTNMTLHRIIAEIKAIEEFLETSQPEFVAIQKGVVASTDTEKFCVAAQSSYDKFVAKIANLAKLKSTRNKANATTLVTIAGKQYTIDEAIARKASLPHLRQLVMQMKTQYTRASQAVEQNNQQVEAKVQAQLTSVFAASKESIDPEAIKTIREAAESQQKWAIATFPGFDAHISSLEADIERFAVEVDYTLSEINATTVVDVDLLTDA